MKTDEPEFEPCRVYACTPRGHHVLVGLYQHALDAAFAMPIYGKVVRGDKQIWPREG